MTDIELFKERYVIDNVIEFLPHEKNLRISTQNSLLFFMLPLRYVYFFCLEVRGN